MLEVLHPGLYTTVQDLGRLQYRAYGMPPSGALDPFLAQVANRLAGNPGDAPLLEFALIGPTLKALSDVWLAVAAGSTRYLINGRPVPEFSAFQLRAGEILQFVEMQSWFGYLAVSGGLGCERVMGSASTYESGRIGRRLQRGQTLSTGRTAEKLSAIRKQALDIGSGRSLPILPALHTSLFSPPERLKLVQTEFLVGAQSNRMGIQLEGAPMQSPRVQRSAPALPGAIQVPPSKHMIVLGPEGPTTGGYPQIAILCRCSWTALALTRPGEKLRFHWSDAESARRAYRKRSEIFEREDAWQSVN